MGLRRMELALVLVVVGTLCGESMAQSGCTTAIISLSPCLTYITGNSSSPTASCCSQLSNVVRTQPQCLCSILSGGGSALGISINQTLALALPGACKVQTPPVSRCNSAGAPSTSPENTPPGTPAVPTSPSTPAGKPAVPNSPSTPSVPSTPAGSGSNTIPSLGGSSDGSLTKLPLPMLLVLLLVASSTSVLNYF